MNDPANRRPRTQHATHMRIGTLLHRWHRRLGLCASLFLIWLALSGIVMNEAVALHLDAVRVGWPWLMQWYGLRADVPADGFVAAGHALVAADDNAALDGRALQPALQAPLGMVAGGGLLYVATTDSLVLLKMDGARVDKLRAPTLPVKTLQRIGIAGERVAIAGDNGGVYFSDDGENWQPGDAAAVRWAQPQPLSATQRDAARPVFRPALPLSRVLADAHSGRLFGRFGTTLIDIAGLAAMLLAGSGVWMFWRAARRRAGHT
jgi:uncharacterized iron-regulated membrane protein